MVSGGDLSPILLEIDTKSKKTVDKKTPLKRDFLTGCALLIPSEVFKTIGLLDEKYFLYYEDRDFCMQAKQADISLYLVPQAVLWHKVSASSNGSDSENERYWMARSSVTFFKKYANKKQVPFIVFWRLGSAIRTSLRLMLVGKWMVIQAYWRGLIDGLRI